jgi:hypothetical protein
MRQPAADAARRLLALRNIDAGPLARRHDLQHDGLKQMVGNLHGVVEQSRGLTRERLGRRFWQKN